jgi:guanyl-specific ribonuclease Sa
MPSVLPPFEALLKRAVAHYWRKLNEQSTKQKAGDADRGGRAAVTGGKQWTGSASWYTGFW